MNDLEEKYIEKWETGYYQIVGLFGFFGWFFFSLEESHWEREGYALGYVHRSPGKGS